jgi:hypothetical protein
MIQEAKNESRVHGETFETMNSRYRSKTSTPIHQTSHRATHSHRFLPTTPQHGRDEGVCGSLCGRRRGHDDGTTEEYILLYQQLLEWTIFGVVGDSFSSFSLRTLLTDTKTLRKNNYPLCFVVPMKKSHRTEPNNIHIMENENPVAAATTTRIRHRSITSSPKRLILL